MIFPTAVRLVERLYRAAVCQAIEQRWLSFSIGMELFIGGCTAARVVVRKDDRCNSIMLVIGGVHFQLSSQRQRAAAAMMLLEAVWPKEGDAMSVVMERHDPYSIEAKSDYGLNWLWNGYSGGSYTGGPRQSTTLYRAALDVESVPAAERLLHRLEGEGFRLEDWTLDATKREVWTEGEAVKSRYGFDHTLRFVKGKAALVARVRSGWFGTVNEAVMAAAAVVEAIWHRGDLVPGGKGQLNKCKRIGRELWQMYGHLIEADQPQIVVPYATRGGRGGWKEKTARRQFSPADLKDEPKTTKPKYPGIRVPLELKAQNGWGQVGQRFVRLRPDGKADVRHRVFVVEVDGSWALLKREGICYRMPSMEWRRLQLKVKSQ